MKSITNLMMLLVMTLLAQAQDAPAKKRFVTESVAFVEASFIIPTAVGDNYLSAATKLDNGVAFKVGYDVYKKFYAGASYSVASLDISNQAIYGNANNANFSSVGILVGHPYILTERTSLRLDGGFGWVRFKNKLQGEIETNLVAIDSGTYVNGNASIDYKLTKDFGVFAGFAYQHNFMEIRTAPELQPLFDNSAFITIQFGIRFYIR